MLVVHRVGMVARPVGLNVGERRLLRLGFDETVNPRLRHGVSCAVRLAEALVGLAPRPATRGSFARPPSKPTRGLSPSLGTLLDRAPWGPLWAYALPVMPATLAVMIVENGDRITLNYLPERVAALVYHMTAKDVVGIYSFNYKLGVAMLLVVQMFRMAWTPFSLQLAREPRAPQLFSRVLTALMLVCAAVFLGVSLFLPSLVQIVAGASVLRGRVA